MFKSANAITMSRSILSTRLFVALPVSANTSTIAQSTPAAKALPLLLAHFAQSHWCSQKLRGQQAGER